MNSIKLTLVTTLILLAVSLLIYIFNLHNFILAKLYHIDRYYFKNFFYKNFVERLNFIYRWALPGLYLTLFVGLVLNFFKYTFNELENPRTLLISSSLLTNAASFIAAIIIDPGQLSNINNLNNDALIAKFPYNELIFFNHKSDIGKNYCRTCKLLKIPRSKHCSTCDKCFLLFDHHCIWLNNCVGYYNYKWFILFLISLCWCLIYGSHLCFTVLKNQLLMYRNGQIIGSQNFATKFNLNDHTLMQKCIAYFTIMTKTSLTNERTGIIFLLCSIFSVVVAWFTLEHIYYLYLGMTTNESSKWELLRYLISKECIYYKYYEDTENENKIEKLYLIKDFDGVFYKLSDENCAVDVTGAQLFKVTDMKKEIDNVYDHGFWNNVKERIITPSYL
ncbi:hypothetical protein PACTADRAFT_4873 [Pachysolen tannophilus NRRL Y-2460]|uniref:Palmitoyltransferase n=1 Tax=Pachysolen tannophilus NRRL Y-2460 TaxID=669874 RepID=A0A1E4TQF6_PACTA|nr:hypothetical protein PACTADRAFT_4873 [Pachysolen tannophilus NRRL Y-2460]